MFASSAEVGGASRHDGVPALVALALGWLLFVRAQLRFSSRPLVEQERLLARLAARLPGLPRNEVAGAASAMTIAARGVPGTRCLAWSLALRSLLEQMRVPSDLRIGVARTAPGKLDAHAWVHCDGRDWSWGRDPLDRYAVLG